MQRTPRGQSFTLWWLNMLNTPNTKLILLLGCICFKAIQSNVLILGSIGTIYYASNTSNTNQIRRGRIGNLGFHHESRLGRTPFRIETLQLMPQDYPQLTLGNGRAGPQIQLRGLAIPKHTFPGPVGPIRGAPHSIIHISKIWGRVRTKHHFQLERNMLLSLRSLAPFQTQPVCEAREAT